VEKPEGGNRTRPKFCAKRGFSGAVRFSHLTGETIGLVPELYGYSFAGTVLVAALVTVGAGAATLRRGGRPIPGSG